jgi:hypothetical protein
MCYDSCGQGWYLQCINKDCLVRDLWASRGVIAEQLQKIEIYSVRRRITVDEMLNDSIFERIPWDYPWEAFGTVPSCDKAKVEEHFKFFIPTWFESHFSQAYKAFTVIYDRVESLKSIEPWIISDGPDKGDAVNIPKDECRVVHNGSIYEKQQSGTLKYVRPLGVSK